MQFKRNALSLKYSQAVKAAPGGASPAKYPGKRSAVRAGTMAPSALPPTTNTVMKTAKGGSERNVLGAGSVAHRLELMKREKNDSYIDEAEPFRAVSPHATTPSFTV